MKWREAKDANGRVIPGVRETDEGYIVACVSMGENNYAYTLAKPKKLLHIIHNVPAEVEARQKAYRQLQELAEEDLKAQTPRPSPAK